MWFCKRDKHNELLLLIKRLHKDNSLLSRHVELLIRENERLNANIRDLSKLLDEYLHNK